MSAAFLRAMPENGSWLVCETKPVFRSSFIAATCQQFGKVGEECIQPSRAILARRVLSRAPTVFNHAEMEIHVLAVRHAWSFWKFLQFLEPRRLCICVLRPRCPTVKEDLIHALLILWMYTLGPVTSAFRTSQSPYPNKFVLLDSTRFQNHSGGSRRKRLIPRNSELPYRPLSGLSRHKKSSGMGVDKFFQVFVFFGILVCAAFLVSGQL